MWTRSSRAVTRRGVRSASRWQTKQELQFLGLRFTGGEELGCVFLFENAGTDSPAMWCGPMTTLLSSCISGRASFRSSITMRIGISASTAHHGFRVRVSREKELDTARRARRELISTAAVGVQNVEHAAGATRGAD